MRSGQDERKAALQTEEAALLPALPFRRMDGGAALRSARRAAEQMEKMTLTKETPWGQAEKKAAVERRLSRAALNHVLKRGGK